MADLSTDGAPDHAGDGRYSIETEGLLREFTRTRDPALRDELVLRHQRLVHYFARRLSSGGGSTYEDLVQVGYIGLITAIERFDPGNGSAFSGYAAPTIIGVIKRYLRDHTWAVQVPRRLRELGITLQRINREMETQLGRAPTVQELAARMQVSEEKIAEALELHRSYHVLSLDSPVEDGAASAWEALGKVDERLGAIEEKEGLRRLIDRLEGRQRDIIYARFYRSASQAQIAAELGISQMHVSRLERQALKTLREMLDGGA